MLFGPHLRETYAHHVHKRYLEESESDPESVIGKIAGDSHLGTINEINEISTLKSDDERLPDAPSRRGGNKSRNQFSHDHDRHHEDPSHRLSSFINCPDVDADGGLDYQQSPGLHVSIFFGP
jgi:hypothetical protein